MTHTSSKTDKLSSLYELGKKNLIFTEKDGYVMKSPYEPVQIPDLTIDQYVWRDLLKWPNHIAIECGITGRKYSYAKLRDHCAAFAIRLRRDLKLQKNDIISICLPNVPEYAIAFLGSVEGGLVVTTLNPLYTSEEISRYLLDCRPKAIICLGLNVDVIKRACKLAQQPHIQIITLQCEPSDPKPSDAASFEQLMKTDGLTLSDSLEYNKSTKPEDVSFLPYSSGTTGLPKGVMLTHRGVISNCQGLSAPIPYRPLILPTTNEFQDVLPCFLPFFHIYGLVGFLISKVSLGAKIITMPKYDPNTFLRITKEHRATILHLVPPVVIQLNNYAGCTPAHFESVRITVSAASSLAETDAERFKQIAKNTEFLQGYGMTELSPLCTVTPLGIQNFGTVGWPISNDEIKIVGLDGSSCKGLAPNQTGEIWVRGPNIMAGYYNNEEATKDMITEDNWLKTGDIGHFDENGLFYISDRLKELIKVNANQVAPAELEGILREHPDVLDAVVIGIAHPKAGEVPKAFVMRRPGSNVTELDLQEFVAKQVIKYKQLTGGVQFIDSIPKTPTGKVLRREVRKLDL